MVKKNNNIDLKCCTGGSLGPISRSQQKKVESKGENLRWNIFELLISLLTPLCPDRQGEAELNEKKIYFEINVLWSRIFHQDGYKVLGKS